MKAIKNILIICAAICCFVSCKKEVDMTLVQKTVYENTDISLFHIDDAWDVTFVYDSLKSYVELEYSAYLENYISVKETNDWLSIGFTGKVYPEMGSVFKAKVHIREKEFLAIRAESASIITMEGPFELESMNIELIDASVCSGFEVSAQSCSILATGSSQLLGVDYHGKDCVVLVTKNSSCKGSFNVEQSFNASAHISSQIIVFSGSIPSAVLEAKEEGTISMAQVEVEYMDINLTNNSEATVNVTGSISGFLLSGSTLYYKGHPQIDVDCSDDSQLVPF